MSSSNQSISKNVSIKVDNDLLVESEVDIANKNNYSYVDEYNGHTTVGIIKHNSTAEQLWPSVKFTLPKPLNLGREKVKLDIYHISGHNFAEVQLYDAKGAIVKQGYGGDYTTNSWTTLTIENDRNYDVDIYSFAFFVYSLKTGSSNITSFAIDNLRTEEIGPSEINIKRNDVDIDLEHEFSLEEYFEFLPTTATSFLYDVEVISGMENIEIINKKKIKGKQIGDAVVRIISKYDPHIYGDINVHVRSFVPHFDAIFYPAGEAIYLSLPKPILMSELNGKAIAIDIKFTTNGTKTFTLLHAGSDWNNISDTVEITNNNGVITSNMGVVIADEYEGWYTLVINECYLHGDGKNIAERIDLVYSTEANQTASAYIDWASIRAIEPISKIEEHIQTYAKDTNIENSSWGRYALFKLAKGALAMDFKFDGEGEFKFVMKHVDGGINKVVIEEITISGSGDNLVASRGKLEKGKDGWVTFTINYVDFGGDMTANQINNLTSSGLTFDSVSIDWQSIRLVPAYE